LTDHNYDWTAPEKNEPPDNGKNTQTITRLSGMGKEPTPNQLLDKTAMRKIIKTTKNIFSSKS
jgi:hypothetical protein